MCSAWLLLQECQTGQLSNLSWSPKVKNQELLFKYKMGINCVYKNVAVLGVNRRLAKTTQHCNKNGSELELKVILINLYNSRVANRKTSF